MCVGLEMNLPLVVEENAIYRMHWCNVYEIPATEDKRREGVSQVFLQWVFDFPPRLNYWQMSLCRWNEAEVKNIWFNAPRREVTASAYYSLLVPSGWLVANTAFAVINERHRKPVSPKKLYNNFPSEFPSWKCCAKFLSSIHSRNLCGWVEVEVSEWKTGRGWSRKKFLKPHREAYERRTKRKVQSHACACCVCLRVPKMSIEIKLSAEINI